jgi:aminoglycoside phosphotransferase (APT) family kinase protein
MTGGPQGTWLSDPEATALVQAALQVAPATVQCQTLTESGNAVFRADLADGRVVVLRVSPRAGTFTGTAANLDILRSLGLPVQTVLATGPTELGGSFIILDWLPGRDLLFELARMSRPEMTRMAETVTDFQQRIGTLPHGSGFGWAPIGMRPAFTRWTDIFGPPATAPAARDASPLERMRDRLRPLRQALEPVFASRQPVCFVDEFILKNILVEAARLRGLIDLDYVCYGDPLFSVGVTLATVAAEVGEPGRFYGEELVRCWAPDADGLRAIRFYSALWGLGLLSAAVEAEDVDRVRRLAPVARHFLDVAEG